MSTLTTVTLTYNEEKNIADCLNSMKSIANRMIVLDGFSSDNTVEIAKNLGAEVYQKDCSYYERFKYCLDSIEIDTDWILFLDADERLTEESSKELKGLCDKYSSSNVNGIVVNYRVSFIGKELKYGASSLKKLRVFKPHTAYIENISLDQHIRLYSGDVAYMHTFFKHLDFKGLSSWCDKHIRYADLASDDYISKFSSIEKVELEGLERTAKIKRILKYKIYYKLPSGFRSWLYYFYRYYIRLGFLDGREGKIYAFLQAYWYRFLVDAKIYEKEKLKTFKN